MIQTNNGMIEAMDVIDGIPIEPLHPPSMDLIDPHRRWQIETERVWVRLPWIAIERGQYVVRCLRPTSYTPELWGHFGTPREAADYVLSDHPVPSDWPDQDMDF